MENWGTQTAKRVVSARQLGIFAVLLIVAISGCGDTDLAELKNQLRDADSNVRQSAAKDLEELGARAAPAIEELAKCLSDEDPGVRYRAIKALSKIGRPSSQAMSELADVLVADKDKQVRYYAAKTIDGFADEADPIVNSLVKALADKSDKVRYYASKTLGKIGANAIEATPALEKLLRDEDESVRNSAKSAIRRIKKKSGT